MKQRKYALFGDWELRLDTAQELTSPPESYPLTMRLPGTTAQQGIGSFNAARAEGFLSEKYPFEGQIWLHRRVEINDENIGKPLFLHLERTRMTRLWVNGRYVGAEQSLCTPHRYDLTAFADKIMDIVLCVANVGYPTRGGHMTSPDTQTNWIGVTGDIRLEMHESVYFSDVRVFPDAKEHRITLDGRLHGASSVDASIEINADARIASYHQTISADVSGRFEFSLSLPDDAPLWSEWSPSIMKITLMLANGEISEVSFGLRDFRAAGMQFTINGTPTMLRGKHDGLLFPLTGAAPTDADTWISIFRTMKSWGINHYRFHTCCPPEACFTAADIVGIYLEPELPFWGTIHDLDDPACNPDEQAYLLREGLRICAVFGNHPSFCMLSLGNELWGSPARLSDLLTALRTADPRPLYTQGSNNFQHMPQTMPQEDFWVGVRTAKHKLIRGSYATCDAPVGRLQTHAPSTNWDYEAHLFPDEIDADACDSGGDIRIQYGTGVKTVRTAAAKAFCPDKPVITHEIGQYGIYPDYREIPHYTGVLEARNFEVFRDRLAAAGMLLQADDFFSCSGKLARDCYKNELEAAMRTPHLAGFQVLDLQDFTGQGTALVGMLNSLLENKGFISPAQWRGFCSDFVLLARFDSYVWEAESTQQLDFYIRANTAITRVPFQATLCAGSYKTCVQFDVEDDARGLVHIGCAKMQIPRTYVGNAELVLQCGDAENRYALTILPPALPLDLYAHPSVFVCHTLADALPMLQNGRRVLLLPESVTRGIVGFYCADFWNYPMFRAISESMGKEPPVGTMGLCIQASHPVAKAMFSDDYTTPQWYEIITNACCAILDDFPDDYRPILQMIDNVERNHRLGILFEANVSGGKLLVCTSKIHQHLEDIAVNRFAHALLDYAASDEFAPQIRIAPDVLAKIF